jgi:O-acetyl-ADP-ribose deacetylase (regulator of RNase III)
MDTLKEQCVVSVYHGDITKLEIEAIVNASNEAAAGCDIPNHCVDSAIHRAAGSKQLHEACSKLGGLPMGVAKITPSFNLPCKFILHVTGPRAIVGIDYEKLATCYVSCLDLCLQNNIKELAFCCLSTGIFGYPKLESAQVAVRTVEKWIVQHPQKMKRIVFCTWTFEDNEIYHALV